MYGKCVTPYERLAPAKADKWRLEQLEAADTARAAVHSGHKCIIDEINTGMTFYLISEDRYRLSQLFDYFEPIVWTMLKHRRNHAAVIGCATSALRTKAPAVVGCNAITACTGCTMHVPASLVNHAKIYSVVSANDIV